MGECGKKSSADIFGIIFQILILGAIAFLVINLFLNIIKLKLSFEIFIIVAIYIFYLIAEFKSTMFRFLSNKGKFQNIMQNLIQTPPIIQFFCECYHLEFRVSYSRYGGGTRSTKVISYSEKVQFPYYCARDVSGLFELNATKEEIKGKSFIKLEIIPEINFADELTYMDYDYFRTQFYDINRRRDQFINYSEERLIPGSQNLYLACFKEKETFCINKGLFILFTIIPLAEFYKCYVNSCSLNQQFKIRKLISSRYDLNQDQYQYLIPSFNIHIEQYAFEPANYIYIDKDFQVLQPTNKEISQADIYKEKIPNYKCVSYRNIKDKIKVGIVKDDPIYCSINLNKAPPLNSIDDLVIFGKNPNRLQKKSKTNQKNKRNLSIRVNNKKNQTNKSNISSNNSRSRDILNLNISHRKATIK